MEIIVKAESLESIAGRCLVVLATKDGKPLNGPSGAEELLAPYAASGELGKSFGRTVYLTEPKGIAAERVLFFNMGEKIERDDQYRKATARSWKALRGKGIVDLIISTDGLDDGAARAAVEGFVLGNYQYTDLKSEKDKLPPSLEKLVVHDSGGRTETIARWHEIAKGTLRARDLCQMPANVLYPESLAKKVMEWAGPCGYEATILAEPEIRELGMGAMLSVSQGSDQPPAFIIMDYEPEQPSGKTIALVGKAVCFDSGGLSLKPGTAMAEMKGDMGGGAAVVGIMTVLRAAGCKHRVIGLVPAVENMPSARATRPSDVVTSMSGITIEVNNTDAEGRLILADALTYAKRYEPDYVIDYATLTGACLVALGPRVCGVMGNDQNLIDCILEASNAVHEPFWQLPLFEEYNELLKSQTADVSNISSTRWGGAITAGLFLKRFADDFHWAHCDIAPSLAEKPGDYHPAGGTGVGVRMTLEALDHLA